MSALKATLTVVIPQLESSYQPYNTAVQLDQHLVVWLYYIDTNRDASQEYQAIYPRPHELEP